MHSNNAAGKFTDIAFNDDAKRVEGIAKIVDDDEWEKVLEGVYTGFSIGGGYARRWPDAKNPGLMRYTPTLSEVSLVDNPAVPTATFEVIKQDGSVELRKFGAVKKTTPTDDTVDEATHIAWLLKGLAWLEEEIIQNGDDDVLPHVYALEDYLGEEESDVAEEGKPMDEEEDDDGTSAHAYASELAHLTRRAGPAIVARDDGALAKMASTIEALQKRIVQLEAQPLPAKGALHVISKSDDRGSTEEAFGRLTPAERARELMRIAFANPVQM